MTTKTAKDDANTGEPTTDYAADILMLHGMVETVINDMKAMDGRLSKAEELLESQAALIAHNAEAGDNRFIEHSTRVDQFEKTYLAATKASDDVPHSTITANLSTRLGYIEATLKRTGMMAADPVPDAEPEPEPEAEGSVNSAVDGEPQQATT
jgi:hypothetical protein